MIVLPLASLTIAYDEDIPITLDEIKGFMESILKGDYIPPIEVQKLPGGFYRIHNGRRRFVAHVMLGAHWINAEVIP